VAELDDDFLALAVSKLDCLPERLNLAVLPQARILGRDTALWENGSGFYAGDAWATLNDAAEMGEVPWCVMSILCRVLTQRRELVVVSVLTCKDSSLSQVVTHHDSVLKSDAP